MNKIKISEKYNEKLTFEVVNKRFIDQSRTDIYLCEEGFVGWKKDSKFYDLIEKDYFWAVPKNVYNQKSRHLKRGVKNRSKTNIKKYGNACSLHGKETSKKTKKTNIKKYGTEYPAQADVVKTKMKETFLKHFGVENPSQSDDIKNKKKNTTLKNYGVEHHMYSLVVKEKIEKANMKKYGLSSPLVSYTLQETNQNFNQWYNSYFEPKPSYSFFIQQLKRLNSSNISLKTLENLIISWKNNKTSLEVFAENLFNTTHYNKTPDNFNNKKIKKYRPDFKLSDTVYLNVDGLYWHSEIYKNKHYHFKTREEFEKNNLRLFQFREDEIYNKTNIVKSIINNALNKTENKIYARKCLIKQVSHKEASEFLNNNHLMGATIGKHYGLCHDNILVCLLTIKLMTKKNVCKIERFCSLINHNVVGGFNKLLNFIENNNLKGFKGEIHNWVDLRYGTGIHLLHKGFWEARNTLGWKWSDCYETYNRLKCKANMDNRKLTEKEHAKELSWHKIYDAGQRLYIKTIN